MTRKLFTLLVGVAGFALLCAGLTRAQAQTRARVRASSQTAKALTTVRARRGESLTTIASRNGLPVEEIARLNNLAVQSRLKAGQRILLPNHKSQRQAAEAGAGAQVVGNRIKFVDGSTLDVDEAWKQGTVVWYKRGGVAQSVEREVRTIEPIFASKTDSEAVKMDRVPSKPESATNSSQFWIYLVGGARFKVDQVNETSEGAWYNRGNLSIFLERERIARITREDPSFLTGAWKNNDWSSGNSRIDELIKTNGHRYGVDPYLVFCVIEHESHFHPRALSPKGARGLMQLMPGTARRFGVRNSFDVADNIKGGTQYLRELLDMFSGQVNLALASYNAGEGAVVKYGNNVPPYRETREYVKKIARRYAMTTREPGPDSQVPAPRQ
jgi:LysM repeat protein